ncbi:unnamed protein product [Porites lobata]|uniref:Uncharacterized protein n=1 Tax=Porites lobata TaxID=104759 RepID=A0ABN8RHP0_9CNID|nr:unnamed protein product [Porites lobata]
MSDAQLFAAFGWQCLSALFGKRARDENGHVCNWGRKMTFLSRAYGEALGEVACVAGSEDCCAWGTFLAAYAKRAAKLLKENKRLLARLVHNQ